MFSNWAVISAREVRRGGELGTTNAPPSNKLAWIDSQTAESLVVTSPLLLELADRNRRSWTSRRRSRKRSKSENPDTSAPSNSFVAAPQVDPYMSDSSR